MSETEIPAEAAPVLFRAGRYHERQELAAEIEAAWPGAAIWIRNFARGSAVPQERDDPLAPCPKCGHHRDTPNHHYGCADGEGRLAVPQEGAQDA